MYYHNKAQQSKNRVHISWDILYNDWAKTLNYLPIWGWSQHAIGHSNINCLNVRYSCWEAGNWIYCYRDEVLTTCLRYLTRHNLPPPPPPPEWLISAIGVFNWHCTYPFCSFGYMCEHVVTFSLPIVALSEVLLPFFQQVQILIANKITHMKRIKYEMLKVSNKFQYIVLIRFPYCCEWQALRSCEWCTAYQATHAIFCEQTFIAKSDFTQSINTWQKFRCILSVDET